LNYLSNKKGFLGVDNNFNFKAKAIVIPFGLEKTVSYGSGTKNGPKEIIKASHQVELYDEELNCEPNKKIGIKTLKPFKIEKKIDLDNLHLKKLDKLDKLDKLNELDVLKKEVMQMENNKITGKANEQETTNTDKNNNNLPDTSEILNRIEKVDAKIRKVEEGVKKNELTNTQFKKRFTNIENTMNRFEDLEKEIKIEYEEDDNTLKKNKYLKISLLLLLLIFVMLIAGDRLGFIDLYIDEIIRSFF